MITHSLIRIRFDLPLLARVDELATEIRKLIKRRVPRAAMVRALCKLAIESALAPEVISILKADNVRRGRMKGAPRRAST